MSSKREIRGAELEFSEEGQGEPVVLVHGSVSDLRIWALVVPGLSEHFRVIRYSRRYHWPNESIPEGGNYLMDEQAEDLAALLATVVEEDAHIVGHSYGAYLALLIAIRHPGRVKSLVLAEPPAIPVFSSVPPKPAELLRLMVSRSRVAVSLIRFGLTGLGPAIKTFESGQSEKGLKLFGRTVLGRKAFDGLSAEQLKMVRQNLIEAEFLDSDFSELPDKKLRQVDLPVLLLMAQSSPRLFHHVLERLDDLLPRTTLSVIPDASHIMQVDNPDEFTRKVVDFLKSDMVTA